MNHRSVISLISLAFAAGFLSNAQLPGPAGSSHLLPNGWRISPVGKEIPTEDLILKIVPTPSDRDMLAIHSGFNPHGLVLIDGAADQPLQRIKLPTTWMGLAWHPDGTRLYVSGGNNSSRSGIRAPIYVFRYANGRLSEEPVSTLMETIEPARIYWAGLVHHPTKPLLFAASRTAGQVVAFNTDTNTLVSRIDVEVNPYNLVLSADGKTLYCSNWGSDTVSVIDTETLKVKSTIPVGDNPNDMVLAKDGRLFVACSNDNNVAVIDTAKGRAVESVVTSLYERAPEGSTPNALALAPDEKTLYVANADNYNVAVADISERGATRILGFIPTGWYPSALALSADGRKLYVGNSKGQSTSPTLHGPLSTLARNTGEDGDESVKSLMKGTVQIVDLQAARKDLRNLTKQAYENCPYNSDLLVQAKAPKEPSVIPRAVGTGSPIKHVIYIIQENRTYDQVLGDVAKGNGDARLTIFGREITPNRHMIVEQFALLDNIYCDAEVSADGHQWSDAAYATDFNEKNWPANYGGMSTTPATAAMLPASGYIWDQCARKGLTYRTYGEMARRVSQDEGVAPQVSGLRGHFAPRYLGWNARDPENAAEFIREFDEYEKNFDSTDPNKRLPNFIVVCLPEDHTRGTRAGAPTPRAAVASSDYGLGMILDRVSHSRYWSQLALFTIEDDAQDGSDHVDGRRTVSLVASPYVKRGSVDSTLYTTSSILRTIELLLGLQPMSQYDAAATPMYASFGDKPDPTPYEHLKPRIDINTTNTALAWGSKRSAEFDFSDLDLAPMFDLNEVVWKSIKGADAPMPLPVSRFHPEALR